MMHKKAQWTALFSGAVVAVGLMVAPVPAAIADQPVAPLAAPAGFDEITRDVPSHTASLTIALVAPPGTSPNFSRDDAVRSAQQAAEFLNRETDGKVTVQVEQVSDWMYPPDQAPCGWTGVWQDYAARELGWQGGPGRHLTVMVPGGEPCPNWANGEQGWWIGAGGRTFQPGPDSSTLAHELGHNMSMAHAFSTACPTWDFRAVDGRTPGECERKEYGNRMDVMGGAWTLTPFSSQALDRIGMLPRHLQPQCGTTATTAVRSVAAGAANRDTISWESPTEPGVRYWVDYRDGNQSAKYAYLHVSPWAFTPGSSGLQILRTDPEVPFGTTVLERPGDWSDHAQLVREGESVTLTDGTTVSWSAIAGGSDRANVTVTRGC